MSGKSSSDRDKVHEKLMFECSRSNSLGGEEIAGEIN